MTKIDSAIKRIFDILLSFVLLIICSPLIMIALIVASIDTKSFGLFVQKRVGKDAVKIKVFKIKTMYDAVSGTRDSITANVQAEISKTGIYMRKFKVDELPQLVNVLFGTMSFVGPRPDVPGYADLLEGDDRIVLTIKPGITGPASIKYKNEEELLAHQTDPKFYNDTVIWPDKVKINKEYISKYSFYTDIKFILKTVLER
ncbi:sugar transferase [Colwellia sp. BRX8-4]|uniref:sugar transferase n=1 Tax=Colwellia sp. BRX8-4 TaxID=2759836 RepID=UPI0015F657AA|nr:sugar transferase [Colwellia sp. BRX8-4]MBA6370473.1 sugar transferase [Colwellia sp. BRX8-4]